MATREKKQGEKVNQKGFVLVNLDGRFFGTSHEHKADEEIEDSIAAAKDFRGRLEMHNEAEYGEFFLKEADAKAVAKEFEQYELSVVPALQKSDDLGKVWTIVETQD